MNPTFLTLDEVVDIHRDQIERYGGMVGLRDSGMLESAVAMPKAGSATGYLHSDLFEMAAAYLFHLVRNHPFLDGNKRTGVVVALAFLSLNGIQMHAPKDSFEKLVIDVASGKSGKTEVVDFLRKHSKRAG